MWCGKEKKLTRLAQSLTKNSGASFDSWNMQRHTIEGIRRIICAEWATALAVTWDVGGREKARRKFWPPKK
jgi:hypothetical protein